MQADRTTSIAGHLAVEERKKGRVWVATITGADGTRRRVTLGPAWVRDSGRRTARGAVMWRAGDGACPAAHLTPKAADEALREMLAAERAKPVTAPRVAGRTLGDATAAWLQHVETVGGRKGNPIAPTTLRGYRSSVRRLLADPDFGERRTLQRITPDHVRRYQERLLTSPASRHRADGESAPNLSRATVRQHMLVLRSVLEHACSVGWLARLPFDGVRIVAQPKPSADFNVLEPSQIEAVARGVESIEDDEIPTYRASTKVDARALDLMRRARAQYADAVRLAAYTGLRFGELRVLAWRDVDLLGETLHVRRNAPSSAPKGSAVKAPKSGKARPVPIIDPAAVVLARLKDRQEAAGLDTGPEGLVFRALLTGGMIEDGRTRRAFYRGLDRAGLGHLREKEKNPITFHDLRHTFGTIAVRAFDLVEVQAYMGHSDISTTMNYAHHVPRHDAARRLSAAFGEDRGAPIAPKRRETA